jgi:putative membrane protein
MKLHPATVPYRALSKIVAVVSALVFVGPAVASQAAELGLLVVPLGIVAIAAIVVYEVAYYRRFSITLSDDALEVYSGVFARQEREIPYRRIQNVDVTRNIVQRLLDIAQVKVETAGGGETEATLRFVSQADATRLQEQLRTLKRQATAETVDGADGEVPAPDVEVLFELDEPGLVRLSLLAVDARMFGGVAVLATVLGPIAASFLEGFAGLALLAIAATGAVLLGVVIWGAGAVSTFLQYYDFRLIRVDDDLRYERGLLQRYDGTIPLEKVQAFAVEEHVLMRQFDFAALAVQTAGYAPGQGPSRGSEAAIPLATRDEVLALAERIDPAVPFTADMRDGFDRPPERARRRYTIRYALVALGLTALGFAISTFVVTWPWYVLLALVALAPVAARAAYTNRGWSLDDEFVVTENGFWKRTTHAVPYDRVQTVIDRRTVFQRRWGLATVYADTASTSGIAGQDPAAVDVSADAVDDLRTALGDRVFQAVRAASRGRI